jgi:hypothetical protein
MGDDWLNGKEITEESHQPSAFSLQLEGVAFGEVIDLGDLHPNPI